MKRLLLESFQRVLVDGLVQMLAALSPAHFGLVFDHAHRPLLELVSFRELSEMREDLEHRLLHDFFRIVPIAQDRIRHLESPTFVGPNQIVKEVLLSSQDFLNEK